MQAARADGALVPLGGAQVTVRQTGTTTPISWPIYDAGGAVLANPLTADARGVIDFYLDSDERVDLYATAPGYDPVTATVDVISQATLTAPTIEGGLFNNGNLVNPSVAGSMTFTGASARIRANFSPSTSAMAAGLLFQTSTAASSTVLGAIPLGGANGAQVYLYGFEDPDNSNYLRLACQATGGFLDTTFNGTGPATPFDIRTSAVNRIRFHAAGGVSVFDTTDPGAGTLRVGGALRVTGNVGFYGAATAAKPTVTGAKGGNAALTSLLAALVALGLVTDSTT